MSARWLVAAVLSILFISMGFATEPSVSEPSGDYLMSRLAVKSDTGSVDLSVRLIEFVNGIRTPKQWEKMSDRSWRLRTEYTDPVINEKKGYSLAFEKTGSIVVLSGVTFNGQALSYQDLRDFATRVIRNYQQHISIPK